MASKSGKQGRQQPSDISSRSESRRAQRVLEERKAKRNRLLMMVGGVAALALVAVLVLVLINRDDEGGYANEPISTPPSMPAEIARDGRTLGDPNAPVHIIEYGDFQCPGCAAWTRSVKPELVNNHILTGNVFFEYRDLTGLGPESRQASIGAACALEQGKFWEFADMLYYNQLGRDNGAFSERRMLKMAESIGLDMSVFEDCLGTDRFDSDLQAMEDMAVADGIRATPTLLVNGVALVGPSYDQLRQQIEIALAESGS